MKIFDKNKDGCLDLNDLARYFSKSRIKIYSAKLKGLSPIIVSVLCYTIQVLFFLNQDLGFRGEFPAPVSDGCKCILYLVL